MEPLEEAKIGLPVDLVIVIDALDECEDQKGVADFLSALLARAPDSHVKFFLTSRPYTSIIDELDTEKANRIRTTIRLHDMDKSQVQNDIKTYLAKELAKLELSPSSLGELAERSGALFIYAATVVRYIGNGRRAERKTRLSRILNGVDVSGGKSTEQIDILYDTVLRTALEDNERETSERDGMIMALRAVICALEPLTIDMIAGLLQVDDVELVRSAVERMLSVLHLDLSSGQVTTLHESFPDYLLNKARSGIFHCDRTMQHAWYAKACFDSIKRPSPPFNICRLESSYPLDLKVLNIEQRVDMAISRTLFYACRYWEPHSWLSGLSEEVKKQISEFMCTRLLLWMEIMSLKCSMYEAGEIMHRLHVRLRSLPDSQEQAELCEDAWRFIIRYISSSSFERTPHIYVSALSFWPAHSPLARTYVPKIPGLVRVTGSGLEQQRQAATFVCKVPSMVRCLAIAPGGNTIVSGHEDRTLCLWSAYTGQQLRKPLEGHGDMISSVAFSPSGNHIASGSGDKTIRIWDVTSGQMVGKPLEGHGDGITSVAFSPNGKHIVSGSWDKTIRIWDVAENNFVSSNEAFDWTLDKSGWVRSQHEMPLVWVPFELQKLLLPRRNTLLIGGTGFVRLDFRSAKLGLRWAECYSG